MATLMTWGNSDGAKGRCDAKCHEAKEPECMCGGRYHRIGTERAVAQHTKDWFGVENPTGEEVAAMAERLKETLGNRGMPLRVSL